MTKNFFIAAAFLFASPTLVLSQDIFWSFEQTFAQDTITAGAVGSTGTAYIFSDQPFGFDAIDLDFSSSNSAAVLLTGGESFNEGFGVGGIAFDSSVVTVDTGGATGNLFAVNVTQNGIDPDLSPLFNAYFESGVGDNGAVLLASVDYEIVGTGGATLEFSLGPLGAFELPSTELNPTFGSGTIANVPEPSSAALWVIGAVGLTARRKRSLS